jgi:hypothetical protein
MAGVKEIVWLPNGNYAARAGCVIKLPIQPQQRQVAGPMDN